MIRQIVWNNYQKKIWIYKMVNTNINIKDRHYVNSNKFKFLRKINFIFEKHYSYI